MRLPYAVVAILLTSLLLLAGVNLADAQWNALGSGFAVTTEWHGIDVPIGMSVTATAGWAPSLISASNPWKDVEVKSVEFVWHYPDGSVAFSETIQIVGPLETPDDLPPDPIPSELTEWVLEHPGVQYWYAQNTQIPTTLGDWGVQAIFHNTIEINGKNSDTIRIRATSLNAVPEVPFGTVAILLSWIGVLGVFVVRKKHLLA
jgi:hypothetical protein